VVLQNLNSCYNKAPQPGRTYLLLLGSTNFHRQEFEKNVQDKELPIILSVFGSTKSTALYQCLLDEVKERFDPHPVSLALTSRIVRDMEAKVRGKAHTAHLLPQNLTSLSRRGYRWALIQSVHLLAGHEFHRLVADSVSSPMRTCIGLPLLWSYEDYIIVAEELIELAKDYSDTGKEAMIFVGHGTDHAAWSSYLALEQMIRQKGIKRAWIGVIEGRPGVEDIAKEVRKAGLGKCVLVPLMLVAGLHVMEDMEGNDNSWKAILESHDITTKIIRKGLLGSKRIRHLFIKHIADALKVIPEGRG